MRTTRRVAWGGLTFALIGAVLFPMGGDAVAAAPEAAAGVAASGAALRISDGPADDLRPAVAYGTTAGRYLVVWEDWRKRYSRGWEIYGRLLRADGAPLGPAFRISGPVDLGDDRTPAVAWNAARGEFFVVWQGGGDIAGRRVAADGTLLGRQQIISLWDSEENSPALAWNAAENEYLVVWRDARYHGARGWEIYGRRVDATGRPRGRELRLSGPACVSHDYAPAVVWNALRDEYFVAWQGVEVFARRVAANGARLGPTLRVNAPAAVLPEDGVAGLAWNSAADEYLVVWVDHRVAARSRLLGRRVAGDGARLGRGTVLNGPAAEGPAQPAVLWDAGTNRYLLVWADDRFAGPPLTEIMAVELNGDLTRAGTDARITGVGATGWDLWPAPARSADGAYLIVWQGERDSQETGRDIYGRPAAAGP
ncbi:MAG: hypothetical protein JW785_10615 [Acidimicrobiia bacterium]|nr:hypothetical protein [Acidimicrobiia bacterium]